MHVGVPDPDAAIRDAERAARQPSSAAGAGSAHRPYWFGADSGLASARFSIVRAYPRRGVPRCFRDWDEYAETVAAAVGAAGDFGRLHVHLVGRARAPAAGHRRGARDGRAVRRSTTPRALAALVHGAGRAGARRAAAARAPARRGDRRVELPREPGRRRRDDPARRRGCARSPTSRARRSSRSPATPASSAPSDALDGRRAHPARGRWRGAPARGRARRGGMDALLDAARARHAGRAMAELILGPMLRYLDETQATVWVETDGALRGRGAGPHASARSASRATTTRSCRSRASSRARRIPTRCALDGERRWPLSRLRVPAERDPDRSIPSGR